MAKMQSVLHHPVARLPRLLPHFVHLVPPGEAQTPALFWHPLCSVLLIFIWRGSEYDRAHHDIKKNARQFPFMGIAVGLVISGEYFGWSYGWSQAGTLGFMIVALAIAAMYCAFIFSFTELTTAIPHAGGLRLRLPRIRPDRRFYCRFRHPD